MSVGIKMWWWLWTLALLPVAMSTVYPGLSSNHPCRLTTPENGTADILCYYPDGATSSSTAPHRCTSLSVQWQRVEVSRIVNITDGLKHGVWSEVPGWTLSSTRRVAMLRVRGVQAADLGVYRCRVLCVSAAGTWEDVQNTELCLEHSPGYSICALQTPENKCSWSFGNGVCDRACHSEENLYDGFDCSTPIEECTNEDTVNCPRDYSNGVCDSECQSSACAWDGGDCLGKSLLLAPGEVVLNIAPWYARAGKVLDAKRLGFKFSKLLRTLVRVAPGDWMSEQSGDYVTWHVADSRTYRSVRRVYLRIDNTECYRDCFHSADSAAKFIHLALRNKWDPGIPVSSIGVLGATTNRCPWENDAFKLYDVSASSENEPPDLKTNIDSPNVHTDVSKSSLSPTWIMVTCGAGFLIIITLIMLITIVIHRIRKLNRVERYRAVRHVNSFQARSLSQGTIL